MSEQPKRRRTSPKNSDNGQNGQEKSKLFIDGTVRGRVDIEPIFCEDESWIDFYDVTNYKRFIKTTRQYVTQANLALTGDGDDYWLREGMGMIFYSLFVYFRFFGMVSDNEYIQHQIATAEPGVIEKARGVVAAALKDDPGAVQTCLHLDLN